MTKAEAEKIVATYRKPQTFVSQPQTQQLNRAQGFLEACAAFEPVVEALDKFMTARKRVTPYGPYEEVVLRESELSEAFNQAKRAGVI